MITDLLLKLFSSVFGNLLQQLLPHVPFFGEFETAIGATYVWFLPALRIANYFTPVYNLLMYTAFIMNALALSLVVRMYIFLYEHVPFLG